MNINTCVFSELGTDAILEIGPVRSGPVLVCEYFLWSGPVRSRSLPVLPVLEGTGEDR
jgi:hypothetical protein